jgi:hypothetical protein
MSEVVMQKNHMKFLGVNYFRAGAPDVVLGAYGEKRTPLTGANRLEVKDSIPIPEGVIAEVTRVKIDFLKSSRTAFTQGVSALIYGVTVNLAGEQAFERLRQGELELVKFNIHINHMIEAANRSPRALQDLIRYGQDARIAHEIFVVMSATLASQFTNNVSVTLSGKYQSIEATVGANHTGSGTTTVTLDRGTTFAYLLAKIQWDAQNKKKRTRIVDLRTDQWGPS